MNRLEERLNEFNNNSSVNVIGFDNKVVDKPKYIYDGFVSSKCLVKPYSDDTGFYFDDMDMYKSFIDLYGNRERDFAIDVRLVQEFVDRYFVGSVSQVNEVRNRLGDKKIHSVKDYKGYGGQCIHRSVMANNLLVLLGYDVKIVLSNIGSENHAFLLLKDDGKDYIMDPSNHSRLVDKNSGNSWKIPTIVYKSPEEVDAFLNCDNDLVINDQDEVYKNDKQPNSQFDIKLPRLKYACRSRNVNVHFNLNPVSRYINSLYARGLSQDEVRSIINRIKIDALKGIRPKKELSDLNMVYDNIGQIDDIDDLISNSRKR